MDNVEPYWKEKKGGCAWLYYIKIHYIDSPVYKIGVSSNINLRILFLEEEFEARIELLFTEWFIDKISAYKAESLVKRACADKTIDNFIYKTEVFGSDVLRFDIG